MKIILITKKTVTLNKKRMKITASKIKKELMENYGWVYIDEEKSIVLIKDTITIIDKILKEQKGISIK